MWPVQAKDKTELKKIIEVLHFKMAENSMAYARSYVVRGKLYRRVDFFYHSSQSQLRQSRVEIICHYPLTSTVLVPVGSTLLSRNDLGLIDLAFSFHESLFFLFSQCPKLLIKPSSNKNSCEKFLKNKSNLHSQKAWPSKRKSLQLPRMGFLTLAVSLPSIYLWIMAINKWRRQ